MSITAEDVVVIIDSITNGIAVILIVYKRNKKGGDKNEEDKSTDTDPDNTGSQGLD